MAVHAYLHRRRCRQLRVVLLVGLEANRWCFFTTPLLSPLAATRPSPVSSFLRAFPREPPLSSRLQMLAASSTALFLRCRHSLPRLYAAPLSPPTTILYFHRLPLPPRTRLSITSFIAASPRQVPRLDLAGE